MAVRAVPRAKVLTVTDIVSAVPVVEAVTSRVVAADDLHVALVVELHLDGLMCASHANVEGASAVRCVAVFAVEGEATAVTQAELEHVGGNGAGAALRLQCPWAPPSWVQSPQAHSGRNVPSWVL